MNSLEVTQLIFSQNKSHQAILLESHEPILYGELHQAMEQAHTFLISRPKPHHPFILTSDKSLPMYAFALTGLILGIPFIPIAKEWPLNKIVEIAKTLSTETWIGNYGNSEILNKEQSFVKLLPLENLISNLNPTPFVTPYSSSAYFMTTSGSTGASKMVLIKQNQFYGLIANLLKIYPIKKKERVTNTFELCFDPSLVDIFLTFCQGGTLVPLFRDQIYNIFQFIDQHKINIWSSTPTLAEMNLKLTLKKQRPSLNSLRLSLFTGEPLSRDVVNQWQQSCSNTQIENLYGPIETTIWITRAPISRDYHQDEIPIGLPLPGVEVEIVDSSMKPVPSGEIGELLVSGAQVFSGYYQSVTPHLIELQKGGDTKTWYRTGDRVVKKNGLLFFRGRIDFQFKIGGQRINPEEIEAQIYSDTSIRCLIGLLDQSVAIITFKESTEEEKQKILDWFKINLPLLLWPKTFLVYVDPPINSNGKLDRRSLLETIQSERNIKTKRRIS